MNQINEQIFSESQQKFFEHLVIPNNNRIIFSGKFGTGKTTFLNCFFTEKGYEVIKNKHYEVYHLFPVNYSIASSEDILELIKYDITLELLKKNKRLSIFDENINTTLSFAKKNYQKIIEVIVSALPKINPEATVFDIPDITKNLFELKKTYEEHAKSENLLVNQGNSLIEFLEKNENAIGNLYESNYISQIIQAILSKHKNDYEEKNKEKTLENILIIDDLDRIDPEHIFRILNVFGSHFDSKFHKSNPVVNKFGFDKIILVCDINNIRKIFSSRYGQDTDFSGYIDKFFSKNVFHFDISIALKNFFRQELEKRQLSIEGNLVYLHHRLGDQNMPFFLELLILHYRYGKFNLRKIINLPQIISIPEYFSFKGNHFVSQERIMILLIILIKSLGGIQNSIESFNNLRTANINLNDFLGGFSNELFRIYTRDQHEFSNKESLELNNGFKTYDNIIIKKIDTMDLRRSIKINTIRAIDQGIEDISFDNNDIYEFFEDALLFVKQCGLEY